MKIHQLKTLPQHFRDVRRRVKTAEVRKNDRDFVVGDILDLREYRPEFKGVEAYLSGSYVLARITHILPLEEFISETDYVVLSFEILGDDL
jgi:hypothetical protein